MAVKYKDYYETLGVSRGSSADEIKKAYRKLARKYHPDVSPGDKASEQRFKELNEAYEVLGDPEKRRRYDQLGSNWQAGAEFTPPPGFDGVHVEFGDVEELFRGGQFGGGGGFSDFFQSLFGGGRPAQPRRRAPSRGANVESELELSLEEVNRGGSRAVTLAMVTPCASCQGRGSSGLTPCGVCRGQGRVQTPRTFHVTIPDGVRDGTTIRLGGQGQPGIGSAPPGDLFLRVRIKRHPHFTLVGEDDVQIELALAPWEALLGAHVTVPTLEGSASLTIPPHSQGGQKMRLRGQGLRRRKGGRGDQFVVLKIVVPPQPSPQERELFEKLSQVSRFDPRKPLGGPR